MTTSSPTVCYKHPDRETALRCNKCENYICASCAVHTPTGYRCKDCIRDHNRTFNQAYTNTTWYDYLVAPLLAGFLGYLGALIGSRIGFFIIILGPVAGVFITRAVQWAVKRRRSKLLPVVATVAVVAGGLLTQINLLIYFFLTREITLLTSLLWPGIFLFMAASTTYMRLAGIQLNR